MQRRDISKIRKGLSSPPVPVTGTSVLQDMVEGLNIHLPKSIPLATWCKPED